MLELALADAESWGETIAEAVGIPVRDALKRRDDRIAALEMKITRIEAVLEHKNFSYVGTWKEGKSYNPGSFVTYSGALWHSNVFHNTTRPGDGDASWTLAVKSGRDGRDAKGAGAA